MKRVLDLAESSLTRDLAQLGGWTGLTLVIKRAPSAAPTQGASTARTSCAFSRVVPS